MSVILTLVSAASSSPPFCLSTCCLSTESTLSRTCGRKLPAAQQKEKALSIPCTGFVVRHACYFRDQEFALVTRAQSLRYSTSARLPIFHISLQVALRVTSGKKTTLFFERVAPSPRATPEVPAIIAAAPPPARSRRLTFRTPRNIKLPGRTRREKKICEVWSTSYAQINGTVTEGRENGAA